MTWIFKKIKTFLSVYYAYMVEYRAELLFWMLAGSLPIILMGVWREAAQQGDFGLTAIEVTRYFITVFLVRQFTLVWVIFDFEKEVLKGHLSMKLLQPLDPAWHYVAQHLSERVARLPFIIVLVALFFGLYPDALWDISLKQWVLGILAVNLAFTLRFLMQYTAAMFSFWTERASAIEQFIFLFYLFLSGYIAPLQVFPETIQTLAQWTPFPYVLYFPVAIFVGFPIDLCKSFLMLIFWIIVLFLINRWLWRKGIQNYSSMGA